MLKRLLALAATVALGSCSIGYPVHAVFLGNRFAFVLANEDQDDPGQCTVQRLAIDDEEGLILELGPTSTLGRRGECPNFFPLYWDRPPIFNHRRPAPRLALGRVYLIAGEAGAGTIDGAFIAERRGSRIFVDNLAWDDPRRREAQRRRWQQPDEPPPPQEEQLNAR